MKSVCIFFIIYLLNWKGENMILLLKLKIKKVDTKKEFFFLFHFTSLCMSISNIYTKYSILLLSF